MYEFFKTNLIKKKKDNNGLKYLFMQYMTVTEVKNVPIF